MINIAKTPTLWLSLHYDHKLSFSYALRCSPLIYSGLLETIREEKSLFLLSILGSLTGALKIRMTKDRKTNKCILIHTLCIHMGVLSDVNNSNG